MLTVVDVLLKPGENEPFVPPKLNATLNGILGARSTDTVTVVLPPNATKAGDGNRVNAVGPGPAGARTLKVPVAEPPPGAGFETVTVMLPAVVTADAGTETVRLAEV
jgi:hypothetical protein